MPKFTYGMTNTFRYKNMDLSVFINGTYGNKIYNYMAMELSGMTSTWNNQLKVVTDRAVMAAIDPAKTYPITQGGNTIWNWFDDITNIRVTNPDTNVPRAMYNDPNDNNRISNRYIEDGSYLRIKNITFGYNFPRTMVKKMSLENIRIYANLQNLYTFTKYSGYDPEVGASTASSYVYGLDNGRYPSPQIYSFGINLSF